MLISQLFLVQIRICRMWILQYGKQDTSKKPSVQFFRLFFCVSSQQRAFNGDFNVCFTAPDWLQYLWINSYLAAKNVYSIMHHVYLLDKFNYFWCRILYKLNKTPLLIRFSGSRAVQAQLACLGHVADSAVGRLEKETGLVPAAVARDFQMTVSKVAFPGLKKKTGISISDTLKYMNPFAILYHLCIWQL